MEKEEKQNEQEHKQNEQEHKQNEKEHKQNEKEKKQNEKEDKQEDKEEQQKEDENIVRIFSKYVCKFLKSLNIQLDNWHMTVHTMLVYLIVFICLFNMNVIHNIILLIIITLDAFSIVVMHECPLTYLEKKYYKTSLCEARSNSFKQMGIVYNCSHEYEKQIELLINVWLVVAFKCLIIMFLRTFNIKFFNYHKIYE
jgi:hypothetical protein